MKKIFKYTFVWAGLNTRLLPEGAEILSVQMQKDKLCMWALVDPSHVNTERHFLTIGTGHEIDESRKLIHLATVQDENFVWHVFEEIKS